MHEDATIFVVDDDHAALNSLAALVRSRGLRCETFDSAAAFLNVFNPEAPGVIITDLRMDGMSGLELQECLAERKSLLPMIVVSGHADVPVTVKLMAGGAVTLLQKPYDEHDLLQAIEAALRENHRLRSHLSRMTDIGRRLNSLTETEEQIMKLMLEGQQNKTIALAIRTSSRTIDRRRRSLLNKMEVETIAELANLVAEYRLFRETWAPTAKALAIA